jgi:hypothetical protein
MLPTGCPASETRFRRHSAPERNRVLSIKDPVFVEAGRRGAATRWGPPRRARLDDLSPAQRGLVLALIENMKTGADVQQPAPVQEVRRDRGEPSEAA